MSAQVSPESAPRSRRNGCPGASGIRTEELERVCNAVCHRDVTRQNQHVHVTGMTGLRESAAVVALKLEVEVGEELDAHDIPFAPK